MPRYVAKRTKQISPGHFVEEGQIVETDNPINDPDFKPVLERGNPEPAIEHEKGGKAIDKEGEHGLITG